MPGGRLPILPVAPDRGSLGFYRAGWLLGSSIWPVMILTLLNFGLESLGDDGAKLLVACVGMSLAWFMTLIYGAFVKELFEPPREPQARRWLRDAKRDALQVSLEGSRLLVGQRAVDLSQPFVIQVYHKQPTPGLTWALLEILPRGASARDRLRLQVALAPGDRAQRLPRLEAEGTRVDKDYFLRHLWPALVSWAQVHGGAPEVDFGWHQPDLAGAAQPEAAPVTAVAR
jgi:hypothetical protein